LKISVQITRQSEYAIKILVDLASASRGEIVHSKAIAERKKVPEKFLQKTIQVLVRTGMVESRRGTLGGVRLAVDPDSLTVADVITAIEGPVTINPCMDDSFDCENKSVCRVHQILKRGQAALLAELSKETLGEIARAIAAQREKEALRCEKNS
jgi:Rrf2 family transcriptional regulator, nitric oxide-sensitive transcriptional repressor